MTYLQRLPRGNTVASPTILVSPVQSVLSASLILFVFFVACTPDESTPDPERPDVPDGGSLVDEDAGRKPELDPGNGNSCQELIRKTCGDTCGNSPGCNGARLLAEFKAHECESALQQPSHYPACALNFCESLLLKTCGATTELDNADCADDPGCKTARSIVEIHDVDGGVILRDDEDILSSCLQALEDEIVFSQCGEP